MSRSAGFTLLELMMSVVIIGMLVGLSLPVYESFVRRNDLDLAIQNVTNTLRRARTYAQAANYDDNWSVRVETGQVTLFRGLDFAARNTAYDEAVSIPASITPSGLNEVEFTKFTAVPTGTGSITLTSSTNDTRMVTVNAKGMVEY